MYIHIYLSQVMNMLNSNMEIILNKQFKMQWQFINVEVGPSKAKVDDGVGVLRLEQLDQRAGGEDACFFPMQINNRINYFGVTHFINWIIDLFNGDRFKMGNLN